MGQAPTRIFFFGGKDFFFFDFVLFFVALHVPEKNKKMDRGWVGALWPIRFFLT